MLDSFSQLMSDQEIRRAFGERLRNLRKKLGLTQKQLAAKLDIRFGQLNKYECGASAPPIEKLALLARVLDTSVDFLLTGEHVDVESLNDSRLLVRFQSLREFNRADQEAVLTIIDAMIVKRQVESALKPIDKRTRRQAV